MFSLPVTAKELEALIDALEKGASRHESYARFYKNRATQKHVDAAVVMRRLSRRIATLAPNA